MNLKQLKKKLNVTITQKDRVQMLIEEVYEGVYGTKNRARLILQLEDILKRFRK